ncbi:DoxX family protein [Solicola gregarius]|uniref:DoxX family protein n=1 Tax=Solicola gregarius TaxID=2908642 RepID=A0AA46TIM7_9ACTN|nr:DoxX family protein [Solicola gregarius]UYM06039.1 DoxX family protein [Solicola gregarius]
MFTLDVTVVIIAAAANLTFAILDLRRSEWVLDNMTRVGVPSSWLYPLGALKAAGAIGLLVGIWVPPIGIAAATGLVLFFVGALVTHVRAHADAVSNLYPGAFLLLAAGALTLQLTAA